MKLDDIPDHVLEDIRQRECWTDKQIEGMSPRKVFAEYCEWHGLINWGSELFDLAVELHTKGS